LRYTDLQDIFGNESDSLNASNGSTNSQALSTSQAVVPIGASPDLFKSQLSENIDELQSDIDILKDLFSGDSIGLPTESVSTLFDGCSDRIPTCLPTFQTQVSDSLPFIRCCSLGEVMPQGKQSKFCLRL